MCPLPSVAIALVPADRVNWRIEIRANLNGVRDLVPRLYAAAIPCCSTVMYGHPTQFSTARTNGGAGLLVGTSI